MVPTSVGPEKKSAVKVNVPKVFVSISTPNSAVGWERVRVNAPTVTLERMFGVRLSVLGGPPQNVQPLPILAPVIVWSNVTVSRPSEIDVVVEPGAVVIGILTVVAW